MLGDGHRNPHRKKKLQIWYHTRQKDCHCIPPKLGPLSWIWAVWSRGSLKIARVDFALGGAGFLLTKASQKKSIKMLTSKSEGGDADEKKATCPPP